MIYFSETPLKMWQPNLIMLDLEDDMGHIYVTRNTYDQAVLISDRFNHDADLVSQKLGGPVNQEDVSSFMVAILPSPINILTPFYHLIDKTVKLDTENLKQVIGVLSYLSTHLDLNRLLKVPVEVRANLVYTKSILKDYQGHFEDFNFRIYSNDGHIQPEGSDTGRSNVAVSRSEREDFELEPKVEETQVFDEAAFFEGLNWDTPLPSIDTTPSESELVAAAPVIPMPSPVSEPANESDAYESIASRFG